MAGDTGQGVCVMAGIVGHAGLLLSGVGTGDPYWGNVTSLLHMEGANGGTTFTDQIANTWTRVASTVTSTAQFKFGASSMLVASGRIASTTPMGVGGVGTGDFTIEGWFYATATTARGLFDTLANATSNGIALGWNQAGGTWQIYFNGTTYLSSSTSLTLNTWVHFALVRSGTTVQLFVNGVSIASFTQASNMTAATLFIGQYFNSSFPWLGYIDEFRVTKGVARYTAGFTPPSAPFPNF